MRWEVKMLGQIHVLIKVQLNNAHARAPQPPRCRVTLEQKHSRKPASAYSVLVCLSKSPWLRRIDCFLSTSKAYITYAMNKAVRSSSCLLFQMPVWLQLFCFVAWQTETDFSCWDKERIQTSPVLSVTRWSSACECTDYSMCVRASIGCMCLCVCVCELADVSVNVSIQFLSVGHWSLFSPTGLPSRRDQAIEVVSLCLPAGFYLSSH